jgi:hypothetical protein
MSLKEQCKRSHSLAVYRLLLELYPSAYLQRHREELLQNFEDLEQELPSQAALWCFIAKDLVISLRSEFVPTLCGQTTIVFTILSLMLAIAHRHSGKHEPFLWSCFFGYALGWFAGWFGRDWRMSSSSRLPGSVRSFRGQAAILLCVITIVLATAKLFPDIPERLVLASCYGTALAWVTGWSKNKKRWLHL